ncbi:MAG: 50S ribosomal protein L15 [Kiritimatiellae bacterium]|nr:50S ribosomal protein L15 [Kiritimatiellia bacterium]
MTLSLHSLSNSPGARRYRRRVARGRGSGSGKTAGRGAKGQMSRKGHKHKPGFEGGQMPLIRRIPKKGFHHVLRVRYSPVNVGDLSRFDDGAAIDVEALARAGLVRNAREKVKILGDGELTRRLLIRAHAFSASARAKIEAAGGKCEVIAS